MKIKDKKAFIIYFLITVVLWQLCISLEKIITSPYMMMTSYNNPLFSVLITKNTGSAFGMLENSPYVLAIAGTIVILSVVLYVYKNISFNDKIKILFASIFTSGVLGNTVERFTNGYVTDYIKLVFIDFPVFNLYDVLITLSVIIFIVLTVRDEYIKRKIRKRGN